MPRPAGFVDWARLLRASAGQRPEVTAKLGLGGMDRFLLASLHRRPPDAASIPLGAATESETRPETRVWRWLHDDDRAVTRLLDRTGVHPLLPPPLGLAAVLRDGAEPDGSERAPWDALGGAAWETRWTIETWTEAELCALHALTHRVNVGDQAIRACASADGQRTRGEWATREWADRVRRAVEWHLEHTQPDNATNRPWSIPAFLLHGSPEALLYAETLLHNAMAQSAANDLARAAILHDAAGVLDRWHSTAPARSTH